jgi:type I restriction enzyme S subunit
LVAIHDITRHHSGNSKLIKGKLFDSPGPGRFAGFSASGQDVWRDDFDREGDAIIVSAVGARCGKCFIARGQWSAVANTHVVWPDEEKVDLKYLWYLLNNENFWVRSGSAQPFVATRKTFEKEIPLPSLPEQRRIVNRIEELFSRLAAGVAALRQAKVQLQRYRQSVLAAAVTGQLTQVWREQHGLTLEDWCQTTLGDESTLVTSGSRGWAKYYSDDGPLFVRAQNIKTDALVLDDLAHVRPPAGSEGARTQVFENDLLITITGANVTKSALVKQPLGEAYVSQHVALVRPVNPDHAPFLYYAIISPRNGRAFLEEKAYGAGKPGLNLTNVKEVPIGLPSLVEQRQIVAEVEARTTAIDHLEAELDRQITRSNLLRQSTLAAAFSGNLF